MHGKHAKSRIFAHFVNLTILDPQNDIQDWMNILTMLVTFVIIVEELDDGTEKNYSRLKKSQTFHADIMYAAGNFKFLRK